MAWSVLAAIAAAASFAAAVVFQQEAAVEAQAARADGRTGVAGLAFAVIRRRVWLFATLVDFAGFLLQSTALHLGAITVVQPILVLVLAFGMLLGAWRSHTALGGHDLLGVLLLCLGLAGFLDAATPRRSGIAGSALPDRLPLLIVSILGLVAVALLAGRVLPPAARALLFALVAGICFAGVAAIVTRVSAELVDSRGGVVTVLTDWPVYALAVTALSGLAIEQSAFASGPLVPTLITLTLTDPLASLVTGALVYGETLRGGAVPVLLAALSGVVGIIGVQLVARSRATAEVQAPEAILARAG